MGGKGRGAESHPEGGEEKEGRRRRVCAHRWAFVSFAEAAHQWVRGQDAGGRQPGEVLVLRPALSPSSFTHTPTSPGSLGHELSLLEAEQIVTSQPRPPLRARRRPRARQSVVTGVGQQEDQGLWRPRRPRDMGSLPKFIPLYGTQGPRKGLLWGSPQPQGMAWRVAILSIQKCS